MKGAETETDPVVDKGNAADDSKHDPTVPHPHDVLCGRGGQSNNHPGNEWFRRLVRSNRALYRSCPKHTKLLVAKAIVQAVHQQEPRGRFIKLKDGGEDYQWEPITYSQSVNKTSQALREKEARGKPKQQNHENNVEIAKDAAKSVKFGGVESQSLSNLTSAAVTNAKNNGKRKTESGEESTTSKTTAQRGGKKRKIAETFVKPFWWGRAPTITRETHGRTTVYSASKPSGTIVTPSTDTIFEKGNNRIPIMSGTENAVMNMGRGVVNQVENVPLQPDIDTAPIPIAAPLVSRQSSMFRFLSNTGIFNRGTSAVVGPTPATDAVQKLDAPSFQSWPTQKVSNTTSDAVYSSSNHMGKTSVQELRSKQQQRRRQDEMDEIPMSGLINDEEVLPPPTPRGLKTQMSDWFTAIFPSPSKASLQENSEATANDNNNIATDDLTLLPEEDIGEAPIPPPPGVGRSVSSALFGTFVESPSMLFTTLKSGVSSMFGDSVFKEDEMAAPIRRFPSSFQQQQEGQNSLQSPSLSAGNTMVGRHTVLGEKATDSLLDDFEETPMEQSMRNVNGPPGLYPF
eukprot:CAMPEP_0116113996 /NCGR_PEP_ID=MMETSP0327-20121206/19792_1 /TAXON_ID=44447 /ORGANISM="Pseudo-nitzschia delicatissima, Strain B596" /LENGTH=569 /DNA_ID=CAMNT_0003607363 /DNA_START=122 /DNA_END=1831 /DNA_ORIENTATION=-